MYSLVFISSQWYLNALIFSKRLTFTVTFSVIFSVTGIGEGGKGIDVPVKHEYSCYMDIAALSTALSQNKVQEAAAVQVQKLAMNSAETQGTALVQMMSETITDPSLGNRVDLLA